MRKSCDGAIADRLESVDDLKVVDSKKATGDGE